MVILMHPSPGLYAAVLHVFNRAAPRSRSLASTWTDLTQELTEDQTESLPAAIKGVLPLLRGDVELMRFAAKIAARFDLYETADTVAHLADDTEDRYLLLIAASLSGNPAVDSSLRARIRQTVGADPAVLIRLDHHYPPTTSEEKLLYQQCWPGGPTDPAPFPLPPVVVLDQGFDARSLWRLASRLNKAGAVIKRLAPNSDLPPWFGPRTVLICEPKTGVRVKSKYPTFPHKQIITKPHLPEHDHQLNGLLMEVNAQLPDQNKLPG